MKKLSLCIGVFLVLFLMINVYTVQAQGVLTAYNGFWLKDTTKFRNVIWGGIAGSETVPEKGGNETYKTYTCMSVDPGTPDTINLSTYNKDGDYLKVSGSLTWHSGTNSEFLDTLELYTDDATENDFAFVTVLYDKFTAVPGYGTYSDTESFGTWDFLWKATIQKRIPASLDNKVSCGYVAP